MERRRKKRARKEQNAAKYAAWRAAGTNGKKSKRQARLKRRWQRPVRTSRHRLGPCGNVGCLKCNPRD